MNAGHAPQPHDPLRNLGRPVNGLTVAIPHDLAIELAYLVDELDGRQGLDGGGYVDAYAGPDGPDLFCGTCGAQQALIKCIRDAEAAHAAARALDTDTDETER